MRLRIRNQPRTPVLDNVLSIYEHIWKDPQFSPSKLEVVVPNGFVFNGYTASTILDEVTNYPKGSRSPKLLSKTFNKGFNKETWARRTSFKPVHDCTHYKVKVDSTFNEGVTVHHKLLFPGNYDENDYTITTRHPNAFSCMRNIAGGTQTAETLCVPADPSTYNASFGKHDWFAMVDAFDEACDQFIPDSFMIGEDMVENEIFIDAFKTILNPSRGVKTILDLGKRLLGHASHRKNLGQVVRAIAKETANTNLFYSFGIKPAIDDIKELLQAHSKVESRLKFLRSNSGGFVPIRVRRDILSEIVNPVLPRGISDGATSFIWNADLIRNTAVISGWGKVREDMNWNSTWQAYVQYFGLNKVIGLAWELVPFSFMVDWFTNAQERINHFTRLNIGGPFTEFAGISSSVKSLIQEQLYLCPGYDSSFGMYMKDPSDPLSIASRETTIYNRSHRIPETSGVVDISSLGLFHLGIAGSIIVQRRSK